MNAIFFNSKRAFHGVLRVTRKPLQSLGLTAARFDLLYELMRHREATRMDLGKRQSELRRCLGVCASVVSRMLAALEKLGLVTRERPMYGDRRQRLVMLTDEGLGRIRAAFKMLRRASWRLVHDAICFCFPKRPNASTRFTHTSQFEEYLRAMRSHYDDSATLSYPWHPDD